MSSKESDPVQFMPPLERTASLPRVAPRPPALPPNPAAAVPWSPPTGWGRLRGWRLAWVLTLSAPAALTTILSIWSCFIGPTPAQLIHTAAWVAGCTVIIWLPPLLVPHRPPRPAPRPLQAPPPPQMPYVEPPQPVATDYLPLDLLRRQEHGTPGAHLSVARFGASATAGIEGERRTARLIAQHLLPKYPAMRVIHGPRLPGTDHAYIDHFVLIGNTLIVIDSALWPDGSYWWDGRELYVEGEPRTPPDLAHLATAIQSMAPMASFYTLALIHAPNANPDCPSIENHGRADTPSWLPLLNPKQAIAAIAALAEADHNRTQVNVPLLARLLKLVH